MLSEDTKDALRRTFTNPSISDSAKALIAFALSSGCIELAAKDLAVAADIVAMVASDIASQNSDEAIN
jgi:hypothetical protein